MNKIKIIHFGLGSNRGGIETYLRKISSMINRDLFEFSFIDMSPHGPCFHDELCKLGFRFYRITPRRKSFFKNSKEISDLFKDKKFDIFHCHINTLSYCAPIFHALRNNVKVVVHSRNAGTAGSTLTQVLHRINKFRFPSDNVKCIAVSNLAGRWLFGDQTPFEVFNNGVDLQVFKYSEELRRSVRSKLGLTESDFVIGNIGAFLPAKNQPFCIEVLKELRTLAPGTKLLLVGDGKLKKRAEDKARKLGLMDDVFFLGIRSDVSAILSSMDVLIFPSFYEGFPNAVLEAQATGLPCLLSDNITREVSLLDNCKHLPLNLSAKAWSIAALTLYQQNNNRKDAFIEVERAGFSVKKEIKKIENLYLRLVDARGTQ